MMKLLMENWQKYLIEGEIERALQQRTFKTKEEFKEFLREEYNKKNIQLTEKELNEVLPPWLAKLGAKAALMGQLAGGGGPSPTQYDTEVGGNADDPAMQAETGSQLGYSEDGKMHKFGIEIDDATKTNDALQQMAIDDALDALKDKGVDTSNGYRVLRTGHSDGILVIGISK